MLVTQTKFSIVGILVGERKNTYSKNHEFLKLFDLSNLDSRDFLGDLNAPEAHKNSLSLLRSGMSLSLYHKKSPAVVLSPNGLSGVPKGNLPLPVLLYSYQNLL